VTDVTTLLGVERMKLLSTRSPWFCMGIAVLLTAGLTSIFSAATGSADVGDITPAVTQFFYGFGLVVMMVMAALAATTEYRFGTIRTTFLAVPDRTRVLLAKTTVVALLAGVVGELAAVGSWGLASLIKPAAPLTLDTAQEFRNVFGVGLVYAVAAVIAVAVGLLVRQTAAAVAILLVWSFLVENLLPVIPRIGDDIRDWLPFTVGDNFIVAGRPESVVEGPPVIDGLPFGPWGSLAYFAAVAAGLLVLALYAANRRDA
jgi:ABC-2 type transport system permease protein